MKNVTTIDLGDGVAREIEFINSPRMAVNRLMIELNDDRLPSQILADFENRPTIKKAETLTPGKIELYEGFTKVIGFSRSEDSSSVRITLARG